MEGQWWDGGGWDFARRGASLGRVQLEMGVYLWGVQIGLCMGVENHFCSVSLCLSLSFSNYIYITHTLIHAYMNVYRLMLPSLCPAQQGPGERRGLQGGWRGDASRRQIFSRGNAEDCRGDELMNTHHMVNYEREWKRAREMVGCRGHRVWWKSVWVEGDREKRIPRKKRSKVRDVF